MPKAPYYAVRRALQPVTLTLSDEATNGLYLHLCNERSTEFAGTVEMSWYRQSRTLVHSKRIDVRLRPREQQQVPCGALLDYFSDLNHAYKFGPPVCDVVVARLQDEQDQLICEDFLWPVGRSVHPADLGLTARAIPQPDGTVTLELHTSMLAQSVVISADGFTIPDQYFHLAPGTRRTLTLVPLKTGAILRGQVTAANSRDRSTDRCPTQHLIVVTRDASKCLPKAKTGILRVAARQQPRVQTRLSVDSCNVFTFVTRASR